MGYFGVAIEKTTPADLYAKSHALSNAAGDSSHDLGDVQYLGEKANPVR
jgi:hypothetical protein